MAVIVWILLLMTALYLLQRAVYALFGYRALSYSRSFSASRVHAGQTMWMQETIANRKRLPLPWLRVETMMPAQLLFKQSEADTSINRGERLQNHASLFSIPSYTEIVRKHEISCPHRGRYKVDSYTVSLSDWIGMPGKQKRHSAVSEIVVFPAIRELRDFPLDARRFLQSVRSMESPILEDHPYVAGIRPYRDGDSYRMVNWSATAKTGQLLVHKRESMRDNDLTIILNAELLDSVHNRRVSEEDFERALSFAASAAQFVVSGGGKAGLIFNGVNDRSDVVFRARPKGGAAHMDGLLDAMAGFRPTTALGLGFLLEQLITERVRGANYFLITAFLDEKQERLIAKLKNQGNVVQTMRIGKEAAG